MNNREVAHFWANQSKPSAKGSHFFYEGDTIYSYGYHFPIARLITNPVNKKRAYLYNSGRYSQTTSKHQFYVMSAAYHLECIFATQAMVASKIQPNALELAAMAKELAVKAAKDAEYDKERKRKWAKFRRETKKKEAEALLKYPEWLEAWRKGGPLPYGYMHKPTSIRLNPDGMIETTKGARVPASVAKKVWPLLKHWVEMESAFPSTTAWTPFWSQPEFNWGNYKGVALRRIALGSPIELVVGCHTIPWSEIELMAQTLGLTKE